MKNVSFKYENTEKQVLKNISLEIEPGSFLGIAGTSGGGKSSLIKVLCKLEKCRGIFINGVELDEVSREDCGKLYSDTTDSVSYCRNGQGKYLLWHENKRDGAGGKRSCTQGMFGRIYRK